MHVHRRFSLLKFIGAVVVLLALAAVIYFAWIGWTERGRPVPDVDVTTQSATETSP